MSATIHYYLKIPGVKGGSKDANYQGAIDILSWSWGGGGSVPTGSGGGGQETRASNSDLLITMTQGVASPTLMVYAADGKMLPDPILLDMVRGKQLTTRISMKHCYVTSYQVTSPTGDAVAVDSFAMNFGKIEFEHFPRP